MSAPPDPKPAIQAELQRIEEDCVHSGKAHFNAGDRWARYHYCLGIPSVVLSALAGAAFFKDHGDIAGIMSATVAIMTSLMTFLKPSERASAHKGSGDQYLTLRNDARVFREIRLAHGYTQLPGGDGVKFDAMKPGTFSFRLNVPVKLEGGIQQVNIPIDAVVMPLTANPGDLPILFEAKSAGDFTNTNKRRKEEAMKMAQLRNNYGAKVRFNLFLCGYFDGGYLGYEATEGIDWVWEHRIDDLALFGI